MVNKYIIKGFCQIDTVLACPLLLINWFGYMLTGLILSLAAGRKK